MIINNAPADEAIVSNVSEIGEFRIRNSAKAFNILSSGLYANKIKAIIRELSCNAVDSHTAAGKQDTPFDVHLPDTLDPTFRIRDYGTGLSHEQVINIYTTYFESTKTESNQFIGALGLGSKSPFSYTDNFTVTAIKDGKRNVYSAFINGEGVPSIALMHSEDSTEPNGVEVQFAVTDRWDFGKFHDEARNVYTYFALKPVVTGGDREFEFREVQYKDKNIVPGVHHVEGGRYSRAVMGNIAYPIEVPNADTNLGQLAGLLSCNLELHFDIGELDFQASREGLSYIPQTIQAIKRKLEALNAQLAVHIQLEADTHTNEWEKAYFLYSKSREYLWRPAVDKYVTDTKFDLISTRHGYATTTNIKVKRRLLEKFNINVLGFEKSRGSNTCRDSRIQKTYMDDHTRFYEHWTFNVDAGTIIIVNDTKKGALTRAKYHWRHAPAKNIELPGSKNNHEVYVLQPLDPSKPMNLDAFYKKLRNIPESQRMNASALIEKERSTSGTKRAADVSILKLVDSDSYRRGRDSKVWTDAGKAANYDKTVTYYYVPLSGYTPVTGVDIKSVAGHMEDCGIASIADINVYGVRKSDIEFIKTQKNWIDLEEHLTKVLNNLKPAQLGNMALQGVDNSKVIGYNKDIVPLVTNAASPYVVLANKFKGYDRASRYNHYDLNNLLKRYAPNVDLQSLVETLKTEILAVRNRYPLLTQVRDYDIPVIAVAEYINLIDSSKGI